ncbi:MAG: SDR family oxidoreductase [Solirubrobacterales bacterium]
MEVVVAGGHGKIAMRLLGLLAERGDRARGLIRNPDHAADLERVGAEAVVFDLERDEDLAAQLAGTDAAVFAAGAGPGSGAERKRTVDFGGAVKLIEACEAAEVPRYLMVSAIGVDRGGWPGQMRPYYEAKRDADEALRDSKLDHTIVRPGRLTNRPGTGRVELGTPLERGGEVARDDVAAVLLAALYEPRTAGLTFDLLGGEIPIQRAIAALVDAR